MKNALFKLLFRLLLCLCVWLAGLVWFLGQIPTFSPDNTTKTDAIVVLTGGKNRIEYGLQLFTEDLGEKLFVSGVHDNITLDELIEHHADADVKAKLAARHVLPALSQTPAQNLQYSFDSIRNKLNQNFSREIIIGHDAENTIGNAEETKRWIASQNIKTIRLVTSNYHMPRALEEFFYVLPNITIIPSPVLPDDYTTNDWWQNPTGRVFIISEYHKYTLSRLRHYTLSLLHRHT